MLARAVSRRTKPKLCKFGARAGYAWLRPAGRQPRPHPPRPTVSARLPGGPLVQSSCTLEGCHSKCQAYRRS